MLLLLTFRIAVGGATRLLAALAVVVVVVARHPIAAATALRPAEAISIGFVTRCSTVPATLFTACCNTIAARHSPITSFKTSSSCAAINPSRRPERPLDHKFLTSASQDNRVVKK